MIEIVAYLTLSIIIGAVVCLYGKKFYFPIIMLSSFVLSLVFFIRKFGMNWKGVLIGVAVGIAVALLARYIYKAGVFLLGTFGGSILGMMLINLLPESIGSVKWGIVVFFALALGFCAVKWCDTFIMFGTAMQGSSMIASGLCFLILNTDNLQQFVYADGVFSTISHLQYYLENKLVFQRPALLIVVMAVFTLGGFLFQLSQNRRNA